MPLALLASTLGPRVPRSVMVIVRGVPARALGSAASLLGCVVSWHPASSAVAEQSARNLIVRIRCLTFVWQTAAQTSRANSTV